MANMSSPTKNKAEERSVNSPQTPAGANSGDWPRDIAAAAGQKGSGLASAVAESAEQAASFVGSKAGEAATYVGHKAEDATGAVGGGLKSLGQTIREHTPQTGALGQASSAVASGLESTGRYLQQEGLRGIGEDMTNLVRRNPIPAVFVALGLGFLIARATTSRS